METVYRKEYMDALLSWRDRRVIKIVTGVRRCGKSTLLQMFASHLLGQGVSSGQVLSVNFEDMDFAPLRDKRALYDYLKARLVPGKMTYIFLDEVQLVEGFQEVVDSLFLRSDVDLYLTGSNAKLLSGELATLLTGRHIEIRMLPLSFRDYVAGTGNVGGLSMQYSAYLSSSSFPYVLSLGGDRHLVDEYLQSLLGSILLKDVVSRGNISDVMLLEDIVRFVFDSVGSMVSSKSIADTLTSHGRKVDAKTVEKYLGLLSDSFLLYKVGRYDVRGKQFLKSLAKYYVVDMGLRRVLLGSKAADVGHILENVVYLELMRRGYRVYVGKVGDREVDFVAENAQGRQYFQVTASLRDAATRGREVSALAGIRDHFPKTVLTLDDDPDANEDGIRITNALQWLLGA